MNPKPENDCATCRARYEIGATPLCAPSDHRFARFDREWAEDEALRPAQRARPLRF